MPDCPFPQPTRLLAFRVIIFLAILSPGSNTSFCLAQVSFTNDVAPILIDHCVGCHGEELTEADLRLDSFEALLNANLSDAALTPEDPDSSQLYTRLLEEDEDLRMPQDAGPLKEDQIEVIRSWIESGGRFDATSRYDLLEDIEQAKQYSTPPSSYAKPIAITALTFDPNEGELYVSGRNEVTVWTLDGEPLRRLPNLNRVVSAIALHPDSAWIAVASHQAGNSEIRILHRESGDLFGVPLQSTKRVTSLCYNENGSRLAIGEEKGGVLVLDLEDQDKQRMPAEHNARVRHLAWEDSELETASENLVIRIDTESGKVVEEANPAGLFPGTGEAINGVLEDLGKETTSWCKLPTKQIAIGLGSGEVLLLDEKGKIGARFQAYPQ
ncbi:MAG: c-type cytochrome domain-containing protein [Planctomycetota bacterium]